MLAQNFKTAADLKITDAQLSALIKTLALLDNRKLTHVPRYGSYKKPGAFTGHFNMKTWSRSQSCGTVACIGGTAELIGNVKFGLFATMFLNRKLYRLFMPNVPNEQWNYITVSEAATALRSYLTTGDSRWDLALSA